MNMRECNEMCEDAKLYIKGKFTIRDVLTIFIRVNISDDLYVYVS